MAARIDVSIEHKHAPPEPDGKRHPNTCPGCGSHFRDDELEQHLNVCPQCGHHFPMRARARIKHLADEGTFTEEAADLRSDDPLEFFDLRPYTERLAEAEIATGLGEAMVIGRGTLEGSPLELAVMDFAFMGGSMGRVVGEKFPDDFGLAESNYRFGHLDAIVPRPELRDYVARLLRLFGNAG